MACGLEVFLQAFRQDIKQDDDVIVVFLHWYLVNNRFVCVVDGKRTEILPNGWNSDKQTYAVDYSRASKGYQLKVQRNDGCLSINLTKKCPEQTANVSLNTKNQVSSYTNEFEHLFTSIRDLFELVDTALSPLFRTDETGTATPSSSYETIYHDPLRTQPPLQQPVPSASIGRSDLDPFNFDTSGRSGMIFDPFRDMDRRLIPTNLPRGAVPPGARFDPFGPPSPDDLIPGSSTRVGPNPSIFPPPQFD